MPTIIGSTTLCSGRCNRGVDRVSALHQNAQSCLRCERLTRHHHAAARKNRRTALLQPSFGAVAAHRAICGNAGKRSTRAHESVCRDGRGNGIEHHNPPHTQ